MLHVMWKCTSRSGVGEAGGRGKTKVAVLAKGKHGREIYGKRSGLVFGAE